MSRKKSRNDIGAGGPSKKEEVGLCVREKEMWPKAHSSIGKNEPLIMVMLQVQVLLSLFAIIFQVRHLSQAHKCVLPNAETHCRKKPGGEVKRVSEEPLEM